MALAAACKTTTPATSAPPIVAPLVIPPVTWEQKVAWIVRLEDQRLLRDPAPPPRAVLREATATLPAVLGHPQPSDLVPLLEDAEPRVRARAALAVGRVGLTDGVSPLLARLADADADVRASAAFGLGLLGDASARPLLATALADQSPLVQGRAAEALGMIGDRADAGAIAQMAQAHVRAGAIAALQPDDLTYPQSPPAEAVRQALYALTRLGAYEALASVVLDAQGQPVSRWWPVAYSLQRVADIRAQAPLLRLLETPGRYTAAFAARGLGNMPSPEAVTALQRIVEARQADAAVVIQAIRALATSGQGAVAPVLLKIVGDPAVSQALREEATAAFAAVAGPAHVDVLLDLLAHRAPFTRAAALRALARVDPAVFLSVMASLDSDADWSVRVAQAQALGGLPEQRGAARLQTMTGDPDARVQVAVLTALAAGRTPGAERAALEALRSADVVLRSTAATALADLKATSAVAAIAAAYASAANEPEYLARAAMLAAVHRLDRAAARPLLEQALGDRDWAVRVRAASLLAEHDVPAAQTADRMRPAQPPHDVSAPEWQRTVAPPFAPRAYVETSQGTIEIALAVDDAPLTVRNFVRLARQRFFDGRPIHRVVRDFVVQDGDPRGDGEGGPGYTIRDELNPRPFLRGTVGMALDWKDTGGSQFFITHSPQPHLDAQYTAFGEVVAGMEVVDRLSTADTIREVRIWDGVTPP